MTIVLDYGKPPPLDDLRGVVRVSSRLRGYDTTTQETSVLESGLCVCVGCYIISCYGGGLVQL